MELIEDITSGLLIITEQVMFSPSERFGICIRICVSPDLFGFILITQLFDEG